MRENLLRRTLAARRYDYTCTQECMHVCIGVGGEETLVSKVLAAVKLIH